MPSTLRIHPAIGIARVGNSPEYYLAPESIAALPIPGHEDQARTGGLPIRPGTEDETIHSSELRDAEGRFKRQAARFRIYATPEDQDGTWPSRGAEEVVIGSVVDGKEVVDIAWQVHVANKKAAWYQAPDDWGIKAYAQPELGQLILRNLSEGTDPHNTHRLLRMMIDPGPRTLRASQDQTVAFDAKSPPTVLDEQGQSQALSSYPVHFPDHSFPAARRLEPQGPIDSLGELQTDAQGRLIVTGGYGRAVGWYEDGARPDLGTDTLYSKEIEQPVNNDGWFDDTSDGPVEAVLFFADGSTRTVHPAWVVTTDPAYAPQTLNVISAWDDVFDSFVRNLDLLPDLYDNGAYNPDFRPDFSEYVQPVFKATAMQEWNTNLPRMAILAHRAVGAITAQDDPDDTILAQLAYVRNPNAPEQDSTGAPLMPLSLGDAGKPFLSVSKTQWFFLERWSQKQFEVDDPSTRLQGGEYLDRATLANCLGGRFSPGIDVTFIIREPELYVTDWRQAGCGPFRVNRRELDYGTASESNPFLGFGWVPRTSDARLGCEPGDISKFMALPWHADYNSCAIHQTAPNDLGSSTLYWSWPSQRPVTAYVAADVVNGELGTPRYSVRGPGTFPESEDLSNAGRFWMYNDMLVHWHEIGVIMQATNIDDGRASQYRADQYLEVQSQLEDGPDELAEVHGWPFNGGPGTARRT